MSNWGDLGTGSGAEQVGAVPGSRAAGITAHREFSQAELWALVEAGADWIWETDSQLRFSWLSENYEEITGIPREEILGRFRFDFLKQVPKGNVSAAAHLADLEARRPFRNFVYELKGAKPECRWISITGFPSFAADGTFTGYRGVARNVTSVAASLEELEQAERRLVIAGGRSEELLADLRRTVDSMSTGIIVLDSGLRTEIINRAFYDLWGISPSAAPEGATFRDLMDASRHIDALGTDEADWQAHIAEREAELRSGRLLSRQLSRSDGRTMMCNMVPLSGGKVLVSYVDVTDMTRREAELAEAKDNAAELFTKLRGVVDSMSIGILVLDRNLRAEVINRAFYDIWDIAPGRISEGAMLREIMEASRDIDVHGVDDADWEAHIARREAELGSAQASSKEVLLANGRTIICTTAPLPGGKTLASYVDVTEMKQREADLAEALEKARLAEAVVDGVTNPIFVKDQNLRFVLVNESFARLLGTDTAAAVGKTAADFGSPQDAATFEATERQVLETGETYEAEEDFEVAGIGRYRIVRKTRITTASGKKYVVGFIFDISEIKRREVEAEVARKHLENVLESLPAGILIYDKDDNYVFANRKLQEGMPDLKPIWRPGATFRDAFAFGHSLGHFRTSGEPEIDALYDVDKEKWLDGMLAQYRVRHAEFERQNPDGRWQKAYNMRSDDGTFIGVRVDITEIKAREEALHASMNEADLLRHTLDELPVAASIKSDDLSIEYVNKAWSSITGITKDEAVGHTDMELFNLSEADGYTSCDREVLLTGRNLEVEEPVVHHDGTVRQLMTRKSRLVAADGSVHLVGSSTDITDVKEREKRLAESLRENEVFRNLIDNVPVAIYAKRPDLRIFYVNQGWTDLTGFTREEAIGKTDAEIFGPDGEAFMEGDRAVLETKSTQEIAEIVNARDGSIKYQIARKSVMTATDGSLYLIGSTTDITELKQREKELEEAQRKAVLADRAKSEFLANMSHEIRTPMNGVLGMAELLAKSELSPKQKMFTDIIVKSGNALLTIINDILDFSKIDAGQLVLDIAPFNLAEAIEDVATLVSTRAKEKDLEMIVRVEPRCQQMFLGDVGRIRQIITNLLGNAVKFTDKGHVLVEVTGEPLGKTTKLKVSVTDTGIGIPADKLKLVFEKFSQVDSSSTRRHEGTGLGLAITSRLVELMGGRIGVESAEGQGSTFWFTVTLENAGAPAGQKPPPLDVTGARILVVDDNAVNRAILSEQMQSWSFDSCAAESGDEGIRVLEAAAAYGVPVDCIVLDYQMPTMTGIDAARVIRSTPAIADTPIVMLTSVDQTLANPSYRELGIDAHLIKPARSSALLDALVTTIQKRRSATGTAPSHAAGTDAATPSPVEPALPARNDPVGDVASYSPPVRPDEHRIDILVAEDNEVNQLVFTQILAETPYTFQIVGNGRLAVQAFGEMNPRMILMDVSMPEMNGMEATAEIRSAEGASSRVPIVGVTAHALKGDRERCLEAGMDDYLPKPISPKALLEKVEKWIGTGVAGQRRVG